MIFIIEHVTLFIISRQLFHIVTIIVVPYELCKLYDWGKVPRLYGTL